MTNFIVKYHYKILTAVSSLYMIDLFKLYLIFINRSTFNNISRQNILYKGDSEESQLTFFLNLYLNIAIQEVLLPALKNKTLLKILIVSLKILLILVATKMTYFRFQKNVFTGLKIKCT